MTPQLNVIGIVVSDMAASLAFYRRLGLEFPDADDDGHVEATLPGGMRLTLDTEAVIKSFHAGWQPPATPGRLGLAFQCANPAEVDAVHSDLIDAGYHSKLKPWDAFWGQRYATISDPDGNSVDLYAPLSD